MKVPPVTFECASQALLDAAVDPSRWTATMEMMAQYSGSTGAVLLPIKGRSPGTPHSASLSEALSEYFRDGWQVRSERNRGISLIPSRGLFVDQDFASADELATSDYYRGFLAKHSANWSAVIGFSDPRDEWILALVRGDREGFFDRHEQHDLRRFARYLSQAASLARSMSYANAAGALDAYQAVGCASFLIDEMGLVFRFNEKAALLIGDGLELQGGALRSSYPAGDRTLETLISSHRNDVPCGRRNSVAIVHRRNKRPLTVKAIPLSGVASSVFSSAAIMLLINDLNEQRSALPEEALIQAFGLTLTEAKVVLLLHRELSISAIANQLDISILTARTHLKRILAKTRTCRQQDLLMLVNRLPV